MLNLRPRPRLTSRPQGDTKIWKGVCLGSCWSFFRQLSHKDVMRGKSGSEIYTEVWQLKHTSANNPFCRQMAPSVFVLCLMKSAVQWNQGNVCSLYPMPVHIQSRKIGHFCYVIIVMANHAATSSNKRYTTNPTKEIHSQQFLLCEALHSTTQTQLPANYFCWAMLSGFLLVRSENRNILTLRLTRSDLRFNSQTVTLGPTRSIVLKWD